MVRNRMTTGELGNSYRPSTHADRLAGFTPDRELLASLGSEISLGEPENGLYQQMRTLVACFPSPTGLGLLKVLPHLLAEHSRARQALAEVSPLDIMDYQRAVGSQSKLWDRCQKVCSEIEKSSKLERLRTTVNKYEESSGIQSMEQLVEMFKEKR